MHTPENTTLKRTFLWVTPSLRNVGKENEEKEERRLHKERKGLWEERRESRRENIATVTETKMCVCVIHVCVLYVL